MKEHFNNLGFYASNLFHLTGRQAFECIRDGAVMVDVREDFEVAIKDFGIPGKMNCPFTTFEQYIESIPADKPLIVADCVGIHSKEAATRLMEGGFTMVANLAGGIAEWEKDGLPMKKDTEVMSGQCPCMIKSRNS